MDEQIQIIRGLMSGEYFEWKSEYYDIPRIKMCPTPGKCPPIVIGGHSKPAYRRAAQYGDGVNIASLSEDELVERLATVNDLRKKYGRENEPFIVSVGMVTSSIDDMKRLEDKGVTLSVHEKEEPAPMTASEIAANPPTLDGLEKAQEAFIAPIVDKALEILEENEDEGIQRATNGQLKALDREGE